MSSTQFFAFEFVDVAYEGTLLARSSFFPLQLATISENGGDWLYFIAAYWSILHTANATNYTVPVELLSFLLILST